MVLLVKQQQSKAVATVKDGTYRAVVSSIRQFANTYGERIGFEFTVKGGQFDGATVMRSTAPQLTKQSKLAQVIEGVLGRDHPSKRRENSSAANLLRCWIFGGHGSKGELGF